MFNIIKETTYCKIIRKAKAVPFSSTPSQIHELHHFGRRFIHKPKEDLNNHQLKKINYHLKSIMHL